MIEADILLVEDNRGDTRLVKRTFENRSLPGEVHTVDTGEAARDLLYQRGDFQDAPRPDLVILDLNLPATSGLNLLEEIKSTPELKRIPVIILTGSQSETDLGAAYDAHANACLSKPVGPEKFGEMFEAVTEFWLSTAAPPPSVDRADGDQ